jgi:xanthine dehydrogenase FAD-binding subunit
MVEAILPESLDQLLEARSHGGILCAGGTDLMVKHRRGHGLPAGIDGRVIFTEKVAELDFIRISGGFWVIGAGAPLSALAERQDLPPALGAILRAFASPGIRNRATVGGNICNASPAGDLLPFLYARDAVVTIQRTGGSREVAIADLITGPGATTIAGDEVLTSVTIPAPAQNRWFYRKVAARKSNALSKLSVYADFPEEPSTPMQLRIAVGGVAPTVVRDSAIEASVVASAEESGMEGALKATKAYSERLAPIDDQRSTAGYRLDTAIDLIRHAVRILLANHVPHTRRSS